MVIGRRLAPGEVPANSEEAARRAVLAGLRAVHVDVQFTLDGSPVAFHERTLEAAAGVPVRIREHRESVLRGFDIGFRRGGAYRGERIPMVGELLRQLPPSMSVHAEIRPFDPVGPEHIERLLEIFRENGGTDRARICTCQEDILSHVRERSPDLQAALVLPPGARAPLDAVRRAAHLGCRAVHAETSLVDLELVDVCHRHEMKVFAFTVNERGVMSKLQEFGADGFISDVPARLSETGS